MSPLLAADGLRVSYGKSVALHDASFVLQTGIVTIVGPNGAGKTTLLKAIMGMVPYEGSVRMEGESLADFDVEERVERGLLLVPETRELFTEFSVTDNLLLGAYTQRHQKQKVDADMARVFGIFPKLRERSQQMAGTLSGGERQMLALGRALMGSPKLLMLDEPSLGLAPMIVAEIFQIVSELRKLGIGILLVEQNARAALQTADYGYVIETGEVVHHGLASALRDDPQIAAAYLGKRAPMPRAIRGQT